jgi:hypothetical protein
MYGEVSLVGLLLMGCILAAGRIRQKIKNRK